MTLEVQGRVRPWHILIRFTGVCGDEWRKIQKPAVWGWKLLSYRSAHYGSANL
jgi:hypothetical protein